MYTRPKKLAHIKMNRALSPYNTRKFLMYLRSIRPKNYDALAISIQAGAGNFVQTKIAIEALDELSKKQMMPIYTFAEDFAIDTGYLLLSCGNEVSANPFSIVGDIGRSVKLFAIQQLLGKLGFKYEVFSSSEKHGSPFRMYRDHTGEESEFIQKMIDGQKEEFINIFQEKRGLSLEVAQLKPKEVKDILEGGFYTGTDAAKFGLVDKIETFEEFRDKHFPNHKLDEYKLDNEDDFDFDVLELTAGPMIQFLQQVRAKNDLSVQNLGSSEMNFTGLNLEENLKEVVSLLDENDFEIIANEMSHNVLNYSVNNY